MFTVVKTEASKSHIILCLLKITDGIFIVKMKTRIISARRTVFYSFLDWQTAKPSRVKRENRREIKGDVWVTSIASLCPANMEG